MNKFLDIGSPLALGLVILTVILARPTYTIFGVEIASTLPAIPLSATSIGLYCSLMKHRKFHCGVLAGLVPLLLMVPYLCFVEPPGPFFEKSVLGCGAIVLISALLAVLVHDLCTTALTAGKHA